jgi:hypothetical protein
MKEEIQLNAVALSVTDVISIPFHASRPEVSVKERDPRAMNRMDPETKLVHAYLEQWGKETKDRDENGFPASTLLGRMIEQGPMGASQSGRPPTDLSPQSALIDTAVSRLWGIGKNCVKRYYRTWEPMDVMARKEGISESHMKEVLRRSRHLIALWLEDAKKV